MADALVCHYCLANRKTNQSMIISLLIAGAVLLAAAIVLLVCVLVAPVGYEDADGFHADVRDDFYNDRRGMVDSRRYPHPLPVCIRQRTSP